MEVAAWAAVLSEGLRLDAPDADHLLVPTEGYSPDQLDRRDVPKAESNQGQPDRHLDVPTEGYSPDQLVRHPDAPTEASNQGQPDRHLDVPTAESNRDRRDRRLVHPEALAPTAENSQDQLVLTAAYLLERQPLLSFVRVLP